MASVSFYFQSLSSFSSRLLILLKRPGAIEWRAGELCFMSFDGSRTEL